MILVTLVTVGVPDGIGCLGRILFVLFPLSELWVFHATSFWLIKFQLKNMLMVLSDFPIHTLLIFFYCFTDYLSLIFDILIIICLVLDVLEVHLISKSLLSWKRISVSFSRMGSTSAIVSLNTFPTHLSFHSTMQMMVCLVLSQRSLNVS